MLFHLSYRNRGKPVIGVFLILIFLLLIFTFGSGFQQVYGEEARELAYDDGTAERYYFWSECKWGTFCGPVSESGYMLAVQFDIPGEAVKVVGVRYYIHEPYRFKIRIFDFNRNPLPIDLEVTPSSSGWVFVDLSEYNLIVVDRFYVALEYIPGVGTSGMRAVTDAGSRPTLGVDTGIPRGLSWAVEEGEWISSKEWTEESGLEDGNFMIRATVQEIPLHAIKIDISPKIGGIVVDGEQIEAENLPKVFTWREGSAHTIEVIHQTKEVEEGTRYIFTEWSDGIKDPSRTITISEDLNLTALYKTQYFITIRFTNLEGEELHLSHFPEVILIGSEGEELRNVTYTGSWIDKGRWNVKEIIWKGIDVKTSAISFIDVNEPKTVDIPIPVYSLTLKAVDLFNMPVPGAFIKLSSDGYEDSAYTQLDGTANLNILGRSYTARISYLGQSIEVSGDALDTPFIEVRLSFSPLSIITILIALALIIFISIMFLRKKTTSKGAEEVLIMLPKRVSNKCPFCGSDIDPGDIFCSNCGRKLREEG